jgi:superfamily I DNA/RNA helicase
MIWLPNVLNYTTKKYRYNWIIIDEAQDVTVAEQKLIEKCYLRGCRVMAVGDKEQLINSWAGSDEMAIDNFMKMPNTKEFLLPISYRCPKKVVEIAKRYSNNIIAKDDAADGEVNLGVSINKPTDGDMVLCRVTAPLVDLHMKYLRINKKSHLIGQEGIIEQYLSLVDSVDSIVVDPHMLTKNGMFSELYKMLIDMIDRVGRDYNIDEEDTLSHPSVLNMYDTIRGLKVLSEGVTTVEELRRKIKEVFSVKEEGIRLSTVHKAKGLEADNVFILMPSLMPIKYAKKDWQIRAEKNLIYVAVTRARKTLN